MLHQFLPDLVRLAVVQENRGRSRVFFESIGRSLQHLDIALVEHETLLRIADRRGKQSGTLHGAVFRTRHFHTRYRARHTHREIAVRARAWYHITVLVEIHVGGRGQRIDQGPFFFDQGAQRLAQNLFRQEGIAQEDGTIWGISRIAMGHCIYTSIALSLQ